MIGLDTSALIDYMDGNEKVRMIIDSHECMINPMIAMEFAAGCFDQTVVRDVLSQFRNVPLTAETVLRAHRSYCRLRSEGRMVDIPDCCIAQAFIDAGVDTILTKNVKHFERIIGLHVKTY